MCDTFRLFSVCVFFYSFRVNIYWSSGVHGIPIRQSSKTPKRRTDLLFVARVAQSYQLPLPQSRRFISCASMNERKWMNEWMNMCVAVRTTFGFFDCFLFIFLNVKLLVDLKYLSTVDSKTFQSFICFNLLSRIFRTHTFERWAHWSPHTTNSRTEPTNICRVCDDKDFSNFSTTAFHSRSLCHISEMCVVFFSLLSSHDKLCVWVWREHGVCVLCVIVATWTWIEHMHVLAHTWFCIYSRLCMLHSQGYDTNRDPF